MSLMTAMKNFFKTKPEDVNLLLQYEDHDEFAFVFYHEKKKILILKTDSPKNAERLLNYFYQIFKDTGTNEKIRYIFPKTRDFPEWDDTTPDLYFAFTTQNGWMHGEVILDNILCTSLTHDAMDLKFNGLRARLINFI